jgi:hypothetical protein
LAMSCCANLRASHRLRPCVLIASGLSTRVGSLSRDRFFTAVQHLAATASRTSAHRPDETHRADSLRYGEMKFARRMLTEITPRCRQQPPSIAASERLVLCHRTSALIADRAFGGAHCRHGDCRHRQRLDNKRATTSCDLHNVVTLSAGADDRQR